MKKLFTLIVTLMLTLNMFAVKYSVGAPTNNAKDWYDATTKTITFQEANSYRPGWWMGWNDETKSNSGQDYSAYDEFVVELAETTYDITVLFEYMDESIATATATAKGGKISIPLDAKGKSAVKQAYLQVTEDGVGKSVEFKDAYFQNNESAPTTAVIYENATPSTPIDWDANKVSATFNSTAKSLLVAGNKLRIEFDYYQYEVEDDRYYQVQVMSSWWSILNSTFAMAGVEVGSKNAIIDVKEMNGILDITLNEKDIATLTNEGGLLLAGHGILVKKISVGTFETASIRSSIVAEQFNPNAPIYNLSGQQVDQSYKGVVIQNGKKFVQR